VKKNLEFENDFKGALSGYLSTVCFAKPMKDMQVLAIVRFFFWGLVVWLFKAALSANFEAVIARFLADGLVSTLRRVVPNTFLMSEKT
jgi:hypothetical protein